MSAKKVLMIVAPQNFRDEEFFETRTALEAAGYQVTVASLGVDKATGMLGGETPVDLDLEQANPADYDAVVFVGGSGASVYFDHPKALELARQAAQSDKVVAAICIAPSILANAGLLEGKQATSWPSEKENLEAKGASYTGEPVTVDGRIVTASGPTAARQFGQTLAQLLAEPESATSTPRQD